MIPKGKCLHPAKYDFGLIGDDSRFFKKTCSNKCLQKQKAPAKLAGAFSIMHVLLDYLSWVEMLVNLVFNVEPRPFTTAIIATEMPAAMRPYSMAVAPELSFTKRTKRFFIGSSLRSTRGCLS
jgi:hypothetical protein